jgi:hypothetical protein
VFLASLDLGRLIVSAARPRAKLATFCYQYSGGFCAALSQPTPNNLAALRKAIEAEGMRLLFDESGAAAGIARQDSRIDLSATG